MVDFLTDLNFGLDALDDVSPKLLFLLDVLGVLDLSVMMEEVPFC